MSGEQGEMGRLVTEAVDDMLAGLDPKEARLVRAAAAESRAVWERHEQDATRFRAAVDARAREIGPAFEQAMRLAQTRTDD